MILKINNCPFCGSDKVEFKWGSFLAHGKVVCMDFKKGCCAIGPEEMYKKYDNEERMINRAIKKWNKRII
jgi:hypothetical protein